MKNYSEEQISMVLKDYQAGMRIKDIVSKHQIPRGTVNEWILKNKDRIDHNGRHYTESELVILKKELDKKNKIIEIFKQAGIGSNSSMEEKIEACNRLHALHFNMHIVCELLDINRILVYRHLNRKEPWFIKREKEIEPLIIQEFNNSDKRFGPKKIKPKLEEKGYKVSLRKISEVMEHNNLEPLIVRRKLVYPRANHDKRLKNKLKRNFIQNGPNKVWVSDVTYVKVNYIDMYVCVIMDLFSRKIVGYEVSTTNSESLTIQTFRQTYENRGKPSNLMFHSDRGSNYTSFNFRSLLKACNVDQSFSHTGVPYDNAVIESFFATMKKEQTNRKVYKTLLELDEDIKKYIDYYNGIRPHETLDYKTPNQFEEEYIKMESNTAL